MKYTSIILCIFIDKLLYFEKYIVPSFIKAHVIARHVFALYSFFCEKIILYEHLHHDHICSCLLRLKNKLHVRNFSQKDSILENFKRNNLIKMIDYSVPVSKASQAHFASSVTLEHGPVSWLFKTNSLELLKT